ncbi:hypothetical protein SDC9_07640 [bioreactor metagenome]|uniref:N-acetyltransferase domain-containing protein n=1 Tax=bioreactor metagenome TaxID=1076179 RepID=A0A644T5F5_9ZZZZ|nr:GNAT family N-acetyltransferase [Methanobrevibacter sp.]MEA4956508.1 GNAT family N-acetyltransferase [Methanobrevibacter sp.]
MIFKEFNPNEHDCRKIAELIYSVDYRTYIKVFDSKDNAVLAIEKLLYAEKDSFDMDKCSSIDYKDITNFSIGSKDSIYSKNKFYVIFDDKNPENNSDEIIGILDLVKGQKNTLFKDIKNAIKNLKFLDGVRFSFIYILDYFVLAKTLSNDIYLAEIAIDKSQRGKGMGTNILKIIIDSAREKGYKRVVLDAEFNNEGAMKLYKSLGFKIFNKRSIKLFNKERGMYNMEYIL